MRKKEEIPFGKRKVQLTSLLITAFITLVVGLVIGLNFDKIIATYGPYLGSQKTNQTLDFSSVQTIYDEIQEKFDGDIDQAKVIDGAKKGLVDALGDKYTYYMTQEEYTDFMSDLSGDVGAGVGIEMGERYGVTKVLRTTPDNPARKAGILAGDIIYKVDGEDVTEKSTEEIAQLIRGAAGSEVKITIIRDRQEKEFNLKREKINNVSAYVDYRDKTAILTIRRFDENTGTLTKSLAKEIVEKQCDKVILDLRDNGGGYVSSAKEVISLWVDGKLAVEQRSQTGSYDENTYAESGQAILKGTKTIVLINNGTASASEIVAGALKDYDLATLVGEKTFGKGSVQELSRVGLSDDYLRITIARWYTPKGKNITKDGIEPDKKVERTFEQINKDEDPQLEAALKE